MNVCTKFMVSYLTVQKSSVIERVSGRHSERRDSNQSKDPEQKSANVAIPHLQRLLVSALKDTHDKIYQSEYCCETGLVVFGENSTEP